MGMRTKSLSDQIRGAVDSSPMSRYAICKAIGWPESSMSRFMAGKGGLSLETLDKLAALLGWSLAVPKRTKGRG